MTSMSATLTIFDVLFTGCLLYVILRITLSQRVRYSFPLPPGPKPLPLIDNALDFPDSHEGRFWAKHKNLYGPISSVTSLGSTFIILNDQKIAVDLLDKRSTHYSSRPVFVFGGKMIGADRFTNFLPYGPELKFHRKLLQTYVGTRASMANVESIEVVEVKRFLFRLLDHPAEFRQHIRRFATSIILKLAYGYSVEPDGNDPLVDLAEEMMEDVLFPACISGTWMVDILPFLRYFPEWLPGMKFKEQARQGAKIMSDFIEKPYAFAKRQMELSNATPSFTTHFIQKGKASNVADEEALKGAVGSFFSGGSDTTFSTLTMFFLAMTLYPSVLSLAQNEIDSVVGEDRLPSFADRTDLPYINALIKEVHRWEAVVPTAFAHLVDEDDVYEGYRIPRGSFIIPNVWQMTHDPEIYKDPFSFNPERFLGNNPEPDPSLIFGFGRRACPGKRIADHTLFIAIAMVAATFQISKAKDEQGYDIVPKVVYLPGIVSHSTPFECSITPRSHKAISLIRSVLDEHPFEKGDGEILKSL